MSFSLGYVTFKNSREARRICGALLEKKWIACANILPPHTAMYTWKGKNESGKETAAIIKTRRSLEKKVIAFIKENHSYETPCIVFSPLTTISPDFAAWLGEQTR